MGIAYGLWIVDCGWCMENEKLTEWGIGEVGKWGSGEMRK